jgi:hypothetical protein
VLRCGTKNGFSRPIETGLPGLGSSNEVNDFDIFTKPEIKNQDFKISLGRAVPNLS